MTARTAGPRVPPHDEDAERSMLGAMMLSADGLEDGALACTPEDFYRPAHGALFASLKAMYERGEPCDAVTVAAELGRQGWLERVGGIVGLMDMQVETPTSNAARYATIIARHALSRRLIAEAAELAEAAYSGEYDPSDLLDRTQARLGGFHAPKGRAPVNLTTWDAFWDRPVDTYKPWAIPGLLRVGWRAIIVAAEGSGKALALDTPILTDRGWLTMGELKTGDSVFAPDGSPAEITHTTSPMFGHPCYRVSFSDGSEIVADAEHLWRTVTYADRQPRRPVTDRVMDTAAMASTLHARGGHTLNHAIPVADPLQYPATDLPIDPYTLGCWLGDGTSRFAELACGDDQIIEEIRAEGWEVRKKNAQFMWRIGNHRSFGVALSEAERLYRKGFSVRHAEETTGLPEYALGVRLAARGENIAKTKMLKGERRQPRGARIVRTFNARLRSMGLLQNKHIPAQYFTASCSQRLSLLQGLMDTDGTVSSKGSTGGRGAGASLCEFCVVDRRLADGVLELLVGLGIKATLRTGEARLYGRIIGPRYRIGFQTDLPVFRLERKALRMAPLRTNRARYRYVTAVEPVESVPVRCIRVDRPDGMFLAGRNLVATHNSVASTQIALCAGQGIHPFTFDPIEPITTLFVDLENPDEHIDLRGRMMRQPLMRSANGMYQADRTWLWHQPGGMNIRTRPGRAGLEAAISEVRPQLVVIAPVYKMFRTKPGETDEMAAGDVQNILDDLRTRYGFALLMEHHAPKGVTKARDMVPFGSSLWLRWPEIGKALLPAENPGDLIVDVFRADRMPCSWPDRLDRGTHMPWQGYYKGGIAATRQIENQPF